MNLNDRQLANKKKLIKIEFNFYLNINIYSKIVKLKKGKRG